MVLLLSSSLVTFVASHVFQMAVIVNDMAEVNVDAELVRGRAAGHEVQLVQEQLVELSNGCICCTLRDDLLQVTCHLMSAHARAAAPSAQAACVMIFFRCCYTHPLDKLPLLVMNTSVSGRWLRQTCLRYTS